MTPGYVLWLAILAAAEIILDQQAMDRWEDDGGAIASGVDE